ncbi:hypothetical protein LXA43DRAFT_977096 [Ganoderma leucocontextum]|nr:hypothetical protein LXA43DRAFT_977096 [Ganoderma leucocontextum]
MVYKRPTFSHPIHTSLVQIASPVPVKHWSNFDAILEWQERTSDALDDGFYSDEPNTLPPLPILDATARENNRRRNWAAYRKVVEADPNTTIAPPWPPFVAAPSPSPSPEPSVSPLWRDSPSPPNMGHHDFNSKNSPLANDGYAWWKYVRATPSSPGVIGPPASRSGSEAFRAFSGTAGASPSSTSNSFSSGGCSLALTTPTGTEDADAVQVRAGACAAAAGPGEDLAACIAQMLLECRADAEVRHWQEPHAEAFFEEDPLADGHVYDRGLEKEIRERAAVAQQLNWMLMGMLPMG